jgi:hypothetical protein
MFVPDKPEWLPTDASDKPAIDARHTSSVKFLEDQRSENYRYFSHRGVAGAASSN